MVAVTKYVMADVAKDEMADVAKDAKADVDCTHDARGVDVVRVALVEECAQDDPVVIVGKFVRIAILLLVLGLVEHKKYFFRK